MNSTDRHLAEGKTAWGLTWRPTDILLLSSLGFFTVLLGIFHPRVNGWLSTLFINIAIALIYVILMAVNQRIRSRWLWFLVRVAAVQILFAYMFEMVHPMQLIFHGQWNDPAVLSLESTLFGIQPTLWLEQFIHPVLTEWLMFSYVVYIPIYPVLAGIIFFKHRESALEDFLFTLGLTNVVCDFGFILFPVAGPMVAIGHLYTVPLDGYLFTWIGEFIRNHLHPVGGTIPSPHGAVATVMWLMAFRYHRPSFYILTPIILSLYVSTFYGRYHYVTDIVVGVLVAAIVFWVSPVLQGRRGRRMQTVTVPGGLR